MRYYAGLYYHLVSDNTGISKKICIFAVDMADIKIAGVMRSGAFSPNHIGNDAIIFNLVAEQLRKRGCEISVFSEEQFASSDVTEHTIISMCREPRNIARTQALEDEGRLVINSGYGIENCTRERLTRILEVAGIPYPETFVVDTDEVVKDRLVRAGFTGCWVKRADIHTQHREDVSYARHPQEAQEIVQEFFLRGIKRAIISRHIEGDLIKFYGVVGSSFFHWLNPYDAGYPRIATRDARPPIKEFDTDALKKLCTRTAERLDVKIYGGDCMIDSDGKITLINFNDWPSFAPCRQEAASAIARTVLNIIKNGNRK